MKKSTLTFLKLRFNNICTNLKDAQRKQKIYKCPDCPAKYKSVNLLYKHVETEHPDNIPEGMGVDQYVFNRRNNKEYQLCVICKQNKTEWNSEKCRYERYCSDECRAKARAEWEKNYKRKHGTTNPMEDPEYQKKLQEGRGISKKYVFPDGNEIVCMGTYEYDFISYAVEKYQLKSTDIINCPEVFYYTYDEQQHYYMPDFYMPEYNLIIEIKDGGDNPNKHPKIVAVDKVKETLKDQAVIDSKRYNYIKIVNKEYKDFDELMTYFKEKTIDENSDEKFIIIIPENKN